MNYISHYYCLKNKSPYTTLGVLLPDILPRFSYLHNKYFLHFNANVLNQEERNLWQGIEQHYADDSIFHSSIFFKEGMQRIEELLHSQPELRVLKRRYLVSHVLYELILDHLILERFPDIAKAIYAELDAVNADVFKFFLLNIIGENEGIDLFLESYGRFLKRRFLNFYALPENLVKSLHMVSGKISQWEFDALIVAKFVDIIFQMKNEIDFDMVFDTMINQHKSA